MNFQVEKCFALSASSRLIACACSKGEIQLFTPETLGYAGTIHFSDARKSDIDNHFHSAEVKNIESQPVIFPDAVACQFSTTDKLGECSHNSIMMLLPIFLLTNGRILGSQLSSMRIVVSMFGM